MNNLQKKRNNLIERLEDCQADARLRKDRIKEFQLDFALALIHETKTIPRLERIEKSFDIKPLFYFCEKCPCSECLSTISISESDKNQGLCDFCFAKNHCMTIEEMKEKGHK